MANREKIEEKKLLDEIFQEEKMNLREEFEKMVKPELEKWKEEMWERFKGKVEEPKQEEPIPGEWYWVRNAIEEPWHLMIYSHSDDFKNWFYYENLSDCEFFSYWKPLLPKPIAKLWMATDNNGVTYIYYRHPEKKNDAYYISEEDHFRLGENTGGQTFEDGPWEVEIRRKV